MSKAPSSGTTGCGDRSRCGSSPGHSPSETQARRGTRPAALCFIALVIFATRAAGQEFKPDGDTIALWHMNESFGSTLSDASSNLNTAIAHGSSIVEGRFRLGRRLNGSGDYVECTSGPSFDLRTARELTVEAWLRLDAYPGAIAHIASKWGTGNDEDDEWTLQVEPSGRLRFAVNSSPAYRSRDTDIQTPSALPIGRWVHAAATWSGRSGTAALYVDGVSQVSVTGAVSTVAFTSHPVRLGWDGMPRGFLAATLDEVRVSRTVRTIRPGTRPWGWTRMRALPRPGRLGHACAIHGTFLFLAGGDSGAPGYTVSQVCVARIDERGEIGEWRVTTPLPGPLRNHALVAHRDWLYCVGGFDGSTFRAEVLAARIGPNGSVGAWRNVASLPSARAYHTAVVFQDNLYVIGGSGGAILADVLHAPIRPEGSLGAWSSNTPLPEARESHATVVAHGRLYVIGGHDGSGFGRQEVWSAEARKDGRLAPWRPEAPLPTGRFRHTVVVVRGSVEVMGGLFTSSVFTASTERANLEANGSIRGWTPSALLPSARYGHAVANRGSSVYLLGGFDGSYLDDAWRGDLKAP